MIITKHLNFKYRCGRLILEDIGFSLEGGERAAILGNNGAGKSTLLKCLNGILPSGNDTIYIDGKSASSMSPKDIARNIAFVAQKNSAPRMTVYDTVLLGRKPYMGISPSNSDHDICREILKKMGLENMADRYVSDLSGGELQKIMLARALCQNPKILLLDEPTSNLDLRNQHETLALVSDIARAHKITVIMAIHDITLALRYCDKFITLRNRRIHSCGDKATITAKCIEDVYGIPVKLEILDGQPVVIPMI